MANIRRHFNFGSNKPSSSLTSHSGVPISAIESSEVIAYRNHTFSRSAFMNEVCALLEHCSAYVQALNSFCGAGTSLAKSLVRVFHNVPAYKDVSTNLLSSWEEIGSATASASAAVKTETLMNLQDVLTKLEGESTTDDSDSVSESIQAVVGCLASYIELQLQFSYSTWKALMKLSKHQSAALSPPKSSSSSSKTEFTESIKKHFAHLLTKIAQQSSDHSSSTAAAQRRPNASGEAVNRATAVGGEKAGGATSSAAPFYSAPHSSSVSQWPPEMALAPSLSELKNDQSGLSVRRPPNNNHCSTNSLSSSDCCNSDLENVINLLSCIPPPSPIIPPPPNPSSTSHHHHHTTPRTEMRDTPLLPPGNNNTLPPWGGGMLMEYERTKELAAVDGFSLPKQRTWPRPAGDSAWGQLLPWAGLAPDFIPTSGSLLWSSADTHLWSSSLQSIDTCSSGDEAASASSEANNNNNKAGCSQQQQQHSAAALLFSPSSSLNMDCGGVVSATSPNESNQPSQSITDHWCDTRTAAAAKTSTWPMKQETQSSLSQWASITKTATNDYSLFGETNQHDA